MRQFCQIITLALCVLGGGLPIAAAQSSIASSSCSDYRSTTDAAKLAQYAAYLQAYSNARSPDPSYVKSDAALAEDGKKVGDWCGKNSKRTYGEAVAAILGSAPSSSAPVAVAPAAAPATSMPEATLDEPTSCKVGATKGCGGCSITCTGGKQAECREPADSPLMGSDGKPECIHQAWCYCKKPKKS